MRLGLFHPAFNTVGGAELLIASQHNHLQTKGFSPEIITFDYNPKVWDRFFNNPNYHLVQKRTWSDLVLAPTKLSKLKRRGNRAEEHLLRYDTIIGHNYPASTILGNSSTCALKIWQCNEPPRGLHFREANPNLAKCIESSHYNCFAKQAFQMSLSKYDESIQHKSELDKRRIYDIEGVKKINVIYALSEFSRDNARKIYGQCIEEPIYPLVNFPEGGWNRNGLRRDVRRILVHSRLEYSKNIDTVIKGFHSFASKSPCTCELHIVGKGEAQIKLEELVSELGIQNNVQFYGYLSNKELQSVYEMCDVFALLTLDEPFGMVYPEAAAKGLLLVGPDHGGPMEILDGGNYGWTVDAFSPDALAEALHQVWSLNDAEVNQRRESAELACRSRYAAETIGEKLIKLIKNNQ